MKDKAGKYVVFMMVIRCVYISVENLKRRDKLGDNGVGGRIISDVMERGYEVDVDGTASVLRPVTGFDFTDVELSSTATTVQVTCK
jgi:hypothetical protein